ncbi:hypothetical protein [Kitasatospora mediocidica]|uniref:hypothetical protein n=1 Tax=Kitasatospora mediocidica TaxID=58352 RepID=UPI000567B89F|nr:hypothetical protein [Kitasatospora mediocidica]
MAVLLHHLDAPHPASRAELARAARSSTPGPLTPVLACLGSGLRRLPSHHGAVLLGAQAGPDALRHYTPGAILTEPAPLPGFPSHEIELGTPVEFAVWSTTGRRTLVFATPGEEPEVVFAPGTRFCVLDQLPPPEEGGPIRVLLRELGADGPEQAGANERDQQTAERLRGWLARRDALSAAQLRATGRPLHAGLTPGVTVD